MKKEVGILVLLVFSLVSVLHFVSSADVLSGVDDKMNQLEDSVKNTENTINSLSNPDSWDEKWDYLGGKWGDILLKNSVVKSLDSFFTQFSIIFRIVFGINYSLSFVFFGIVFLWLFVFLESARVFGVFERTQGLIAYFVSGVLAMMFANFKAFEYLALNLGRFIFSSESVLSRVIFFLIVVAGFFLLNYLNGFFIKSLKKDIKMQKKEEENFNKWSLKKIAEFYRKRYT